MKKEEIDKFKITMISGNLLPEEASKFLKKYNKELKKELRFPPKLTKPSNFVFGSFVKYRNWGTSCSARKRSKIKTAIHFPLPKARTKN